MAGHRCVLRQHPGGIGDGGGATCSDGAECRSHVGPVLGRRSAADVTRSGLAGDLVGLDSGLCVAATDAGVAVVSVAWALGLLGVAGVVAAGSGVALRRAVTASTSGGRTGELISVVGADGGHTAMLRGVGRRWGIAQILEISGTGSDRVQEDEQIADQRLRQQAVRALFEGGWTVRFLAVRRGAGEPDAASYGHDVLDALHQRAESAISDVYTTRRYLIVSGYGRATVELDEVMDRAQGSLAVWGARRLTVDEMGALVRRLYELPRESRITGLPSGLGVDIEVDRATGLVVTIDGQKRRYSAAISVSLWDVEDAPHVIEGLVRLSGSLDVCLLGRAIPAQRRRAELAVRRTQARLGGLNRIVDAEYQIFSDILAQGADDAVETHLCVTVHGDSAADAARLTSLVHQHFDSLGMQTITERRGAPYAWLARAPGYDRLLRPRLLRGANVARAWEWRQQPVGLRRCSWGAGPIRTFRSAEGSAYRYQFHANAQAQSLGHTIVFGTAGSGKTTLCAWLLSGAMRHSRLFGAVIDRHLGLRVWAEALGLPYLDPVTEMQINPLMIEDHPANRSFLAQYLCMLAQTPDEMDNAGSAVDKIMAVPPARRILREVWTSAFHDSPLKDGLKIWAMGQYSNILNGRKNDLDFSSRFAVFDLTEAAKDRRVNAALITYFAHAVKEESARRNGPHLIYVDEAQPLLEDVVFRQTMKEVFQEHRKKEGVIIMVFQGPEGLLNTEISGAALQNAQNIIIFPTENARWETWKQLKLTNAEWSFVNGEHPVNRQLKRPFLLKKGAQSVYLDSDLSFLGKYFRVLEGGTKAVSRMRRAQEQWGDGWLERYIED